MNIVKLLCINTLALVSFISQASETDANKCIGALIDAEALIDSKKQTHGIDSYGIKGKRGFIQMKLSEDNIKITPKRGLIADIYSCSNFEGITVNEIDLVLKAYHGYLTSDFSNMAAQCFRFILSVEASLSKKYGEKVGKNTGLRLGEIFGAQLQTLNYLFPKKAVSINEVPKLTQMLRVENNAAEYSKSCSVLGVPANDYFIAATITHY